MTDAATSSSRPRLALYALLPAVPVLNLGYQFCAEKLAHVTSGVPFGLAWFAAFMGQPWALVLIALEIANFSAWMVVLSRLPVSAAFPLTAMSYGLVIALGWFAFHEPVHPLEIIGGLLIAVGIFLIGGEGRPEH